MRSRPPQRRACTTTTITVEGRHYHISLGHYEDGRVCEIFCHGARAGSDQDRLIDDVGVLLSVLLQYGVEPEDLASSLGWLPDGSPASIIGHLVRAAFP